MFNVGGGELLVILLVALIVLGPQRLPDAARQVGRVMGDIRRISNGFQRELKDAFDVDEGASPRRTEPVPLARAVAEADDRPEPHRAGADAPTPALRDVSAAPADGSNVADAVAEALDEIVGSPAPASGPPAPSPATVPPARPRRRPSRPQAPTTAATSVRRPSLPERFLTHPGEAEASA